MKKVHITLVGGQTYPVYLGIKASSPEMVYLIHSPQTHGETERIAAEFSASGIHFKPESCDPVNVALILEKAQRLADSMSDDDEYTLNLTGGTKVWSIVFHEAFEKKPHVKFIYIDQSCNIYDLSTGDKEPYGEPIDTDSVFRLNNNGDPRYLKFTDLTPDDLDKVKQLMQLRGFNVKHFSELTCPRSKEGQLALKESEGMYTYDGSKFSWNCRENKVSFSLVNSNTSGGNPKQVTLSSPHIVDLTTYASWFEADVARRISLWKHSREVRLNVRFPNSIKTDKNVRFPNSTETDKNEIDVIVNTGTRLLFVECKTNTNEPTALDKFKSAVDNYGGMGTIALFVMLSTIAGKPNVLEKCRDNRIIHFSYQDAIGSTKFGKNDEAINKALHKLLDERLGDINTK